MQIRKPFLSLSLLALLGALSQSLAPQDLHGGDWSSSGAPMDSIDPGEEMDVMNCRVSIFDGRSEIRKIGVRSYTNIVSGWTAQLQAEPTAELTAFAEIKLKGEREAIDLVMKLQRTPDGLFIVRTSNRDRRDIRALSGDRMESLSFLAEARGNFNTVVVVNVPDAGPQELKMVCRTARKFTKALP